MGEHIRAARKRGSVRAAVFLLAAALCAALCAGCEKEMEPLSRTEFHLDTVATVTLYDWADETTLDRAMDEIARLEGVLSAHVETSEIARLSAAAGGEEVALSEETVSLLKQAKELSGLTGGAFDLTCGPLVSAWAICDGGGRVPSDAEREAAAALVDYQKLTVSESGARLTEPGMAVDLGAIAKGYIADRVGDLLRKEGVTSAVVNLGGNVLLIGAKPDGSDFRVGVRDPQGDESSLAAVACGRDEAFVTSGTYERWFEQDGVRYHHILDPDTGFPADSGLAGVTILTDSAVRADALSTACLVMGLERSMELIESLPDTEALLITDDGEQFTTEGFSARMS